VADLAAVVLRAIVDKNNLNILIGLRKDRVQRAWQKCRRIVYGNNNTNHVEDITDEISQKTLNTSPSVSNVIIDKKAWLKKRYNIESNYEPYDLNVNYIDIDKIISNKDKFITTITEPMIVNFVIHNPKLKEKIGTDVNISHTGFLIPHNNSIVLRHASSYKKKVNEIDIFEYLKKIRKHQEYKGLNFLEIKP
jgi:hypothetical protein